jgi:mono/diheme cytochrome c family protein
MRFILALIKLVSFLSVVSVFALATLIGWGSWKTQQALQRHHAFPAIKIQRDHSPERLELGKRIVTIRNGCVDCHGQDLAGKVVVQDLGMGEIWGSNITPFALKDWSDEQIAQAIRNGINRDGRSLILMPSHEYQSLSHADLGSVISYLREAPSIVRVPPRPSLGPLAKTLFALGRIPTLIPADSIIPVSKGFVAKPAEAPTAEFGKYLVATSCQGCHGERLAGGPIPGGPPSWPPASDLRGLTGQGWNYATFTRAMREGINKKDQSIRPPMPILLTRQMNETELQAMWAYLRER